MHVMGSTQDHTEMCCDALSDQQDQTNPDMPLCPLCDGADALTENAHETARLTPVTHPNYMTLLKHGGGMMYFWYTSTTLPYRCGYDQPSANFVQRPRCPIVLSRTAIPISGEG